MGAKKSTLRQVIWCDTEGGVKGVPLWDATFICDRGQSVVAKRFCAPAMATARGKAALRKTLSARVYDDGSRGKGTTCVTTHTLCKDSGSWATQEQAVVDSAIQTLIVDYLLQLDRSVLVAWNMHRHDKHVLTRAVGGAVISQHVLWDALPWFRSRFSLPKNTLSSSKPGTPRAVFEVPEYGKAHSSFADAAHMRDVVCRAAYCAEHSSNNTDAWKTSSRSAIDDAVRRQLEKDGIN